MKKFLVLLAIVAMCAFGAPALAGDMHAEEQGVGVPYDLSSLVEGIRENCIVIPVIPEYISEDDEAVKAVPIIILIVAPSPTPEFEEEENESKFIPYRR